MNGIHNCYNTYPELAEPTFMNTLLLDSDCIACVSVEYCNEI